MYNATLTSLCFMVLLMLLFKVQIANFFESKNPKCPKCAKELNIEPGTDGKLTYICHNCDE